MNPLKKHRDFLDQIDKQIMDLLEKRFIVTKEIGEIKAREAMVIENKSREQEILEKTKRYTYNEEIQALYEYLFDLSKASQRNKSS
ncbi:MAG: chorismate mutase [Candidatus Izemoplasmataceae bacterium]